VYVVRATYGGDAFRGQSRQDKRRAGPQIADLDISAWSRVGPRIVAWC